RCLTRVALLDGTEWLPVRGGQMNGRIPGTPPPEPPRGGDKAKGGAPTPGAPRGGVLLILFLALLAFGVSQVVFARPAATPIRYDELKRYLREDRVDWVVLTDDEIRGAFEEGKVPTHDGRPRGDTFVTPRLDDDQLVAELQRAGVAFRGQPSSPWAESWPTLIYIGMTIF